MCNGDLGMYRVMPWAYPTIPGQSSGGTTVDPTPEPTPIPKDPFDFSNVGFSMPSVKGSYSSPNSTVIIYLQVRNIVTNDTSNVSSVKFELVGDSISINPSVVDGTKLKVSVSSYTARSFNNLNSDYALITATQVYVPAVAQTTFSATGVTGVKITVYGSDGEVLQTHEGVIS